MTTIVAKSVVPCRRGISRPEIAWTARRPIPLTEKTVSVITAPERRPENCIAIKSHSENEGLLEYLQGLGLITKVLCYVHSGYVRIPICEYDHEVLDRYCADAA